MDEQDNETPDWLWSIVKEFQTLASGRQSEIQPMIRTWLTSEGQRLTAMKSFMESLPKRRTKCMAKRAKKQETLRKWLTDNPIPKDVIACREVARLVAASNAVIDKTPGERVETLRWQRMAPLLGTLAEQSAWCLLFPSEPKDWPAWQRDLEASLELVKRNRDRLWPDSQGNTPAVAPKGSQPANKSATASIAERIMEEFRITRPQAVAIVRAMVELEATEPESAKLESVIMEKAGVTTRISGAFSDGSVKDERYLKFRKIYIKNTRTRKGLYYLALT